MAISNAIQDLKDRVLSAYGACGKRKAEMPEVRNTWNLPDCIHSIPSHCVPYDNACNEVEFCQQTLLEEGGKGEYAGAWICLRYAGADYEDFALSETAVRAVRSSDGHFYTYENDGASVTHCWDSTKDFDIDGVAAGHKFNWVIYYFGQDIIDSTADYLDCLKATNIIYVFDMDLRFCSVTSGSTRNAYGLCRMNGVL